MRIPSSVPMPNEVPIEQEIVAYVGRDWADHQHVICWQAAGSVSVQSAVVQQRPEELQAWVAELRQRFPQGLVAIALEQSRFFFSSRRRHTRFDCDWSSDVCSSD